MKKTIFTLTVVLLVVAFGVSAFLVGNYVINSKKEGDRYADLATMTASTAATTEAVETTGAETTGATEETEPTETTEATEPKMLYQAQYDLNNDMVGWIRIDDPESTEEDPKDPWMNYPVMQTPSDGDYYLKRNFDKERSEWGCIFAWETADINRPSDNITLFGHNMNDGSMFACLHRYTDKKVWEANPWIYFDTLYEGHIYKIFAVFKTTAAQGKGFVYHDVTDFANKAEFDSFVKSCKDLAYFDTGVTPQYGDKLICLSTCEYTDIFGHGRLVVAAVRWDF